MSERIPTDVLAGRLRATEADVYFNGSRDLSKLLHDAADRLAELAALEPVGELLAVRGLRQEVSLSIRARHQHGSAHMSLIFQDYVEASWFEQADTAEAALAALAEAVR